MIGDKVYVIRLKSTDKFNGNFYKGKQRFAKEGQTMTRKQLSACLRYAVSTSKHFENGSIEVLELEMNLTATFEVDNLNDFKLIEKRNDSLNGLLD